MHRRRMSGLGLVAAAAGAVSIAYVAARMASAAPLPTLHAIGWVGLAIYCLVGAYLTARFASRGLLTTWQDWSLLALFWLSATLWGYVMLV